MRVKAGENKSWALITFEDIASAKACHDEGIAVMDEKYILNSIIRLRAEQYCIGMLHHFGC